MLISRWCVLFLLYCNISFAVDVNKIDRYTVSFSDKVKKVLGEDPSVGSSLKFASRLNDGFLFYGITNRGPNVTLSKDGQNYVLISNPEFVPSIVKIKVTPKNKKAEVLDVIPLFYQGKPVTGVPQVDSGIFGAKTEIPLDIYGKNVPSNGRLSIDLEGLALADNGYFWVSDEYFPSLNYVNSSGHIINRYMINKGLPGIVKWRMPNRGFEGVAVTPNGKVYMTLEGILDVDYQTKDRASFIRIIEFDPKTQVSRMFAYPFDRDMYKKWHKVKIGDIDALNNEEFLLIEQGVKKDGGFRNAVFQINIRDAIDITTKKLSDGKELEYGAFE